MGVELVGTRRAEEEYEALLEECPGAMFHHTLLWRDVLCDVLGDEPVYLMLREGGRVSALLPGFVRKTSEGGVFNSLPLSGSHGGVLVRKGADRAKAARELLDAARELAATEGCLAATVVSSPLAPSCEEYVSCWLPRFTCERVTQITWLDRELRFAPSVRNHLRKAASFGLEVDRSLELADLPELWELYASGDERSRPVKPLSFFVSLHGRGAAGGRVRFFGARADGRLVAGLVLLIAFGGVTAHEVVMDRRASRLQAVSLLLDEALRWAREAGFRYWNWGASVPGSGVHRFKRSWGASDIPYAYYTTLLGPPERLRGLGPECVGELFRWYYVAPYDALWPGPARVPRREGAAT